MEEPVLLYLVGTAGSGKTVMAGAIPRWMKGAGYDAITVNLDPGADELPYEPEIDIREWIRLDEVMRDYGLGPNGAQVLGADLLALNIGEVRKEIEKIDTDLVVIDTPGQIELFAFRESSRVLTSTLGSERATLAFLFDPALAKKPSGLVSLFMLCATVQMRFLIPAINILSKADLLSPDDAANISRWSTDPYALLNALQDQTAQEAPSGTGPHAMSANLGIELFKALETISIYKPLTPVSGETLAGIEDVYNIVRQSFSGGDDPDRR